MHFSRYPELDTLTNPDKGKDVNNQRGAAGGRVRPAIDSLSWVPDAILLFFNQEILSPHSFICKKKYQQTTVHLQTLDTVQIKQFIYVGSYLRWQPYP